MSDFVAPTQTVKIIQWESSCWESSSPTTSLLMMPHVALITTGKSVSCQWIIKLCVLLTDTERWRFTWKKTAGRRKWRRLKFSFLLCLKLPHCLKEVICVCVCFQIHPVSHQQCVLCEVQRRLRSCRWNNRPPPEEYDQHGRCTKLFSVWFNQLYQFLHLQRTFNTFIFDVELTVSFRISWSWILLF